VVLVLVMSSDLLAGGTWAEVGRKQTNVGHGAVAFGFAAALVDDRFVGPDPALNGVGVCL
jgi:hypothetical protein